VQKTTKQQLIDTTLNTVCDASHMLVCEGAMIHNHRHHKHNINNTRNSTITDKSDDASHLCDTKRHGWPLKHDPPHTCHHAEFGSSTSPGLGVTKGTQKIGSTGALPPWDEASGWPLKTHSFPICVTTSHVVILNQRLWA